MTRLTGMVKNHRSNRQITTAFLIILGLALPATARENVTDPSIASAIEDEYLFDPGVAFNEVDVEVVDGVATLEGGVYNVLAKERAAKIAGLVRGVRSVVNRIEVNPAPNRSEGEIKRDVLAALAADPAADSYEIQAFVGPKGLLTLKGTVQSWQERELTLTVAKGVRGVTSINNQIEIEYRTQRTDSEIRPEVERTLHWDALVDNGLIDVTVDEGHVFLSGTVGSVAERNQAINDAWRVAGVKAVIGDDLKVERWARDEDLRKQKYASKDDSEIKDAIVDALVYDPRVLAAHVDTSVSNSRVTLRGTVANLRAKRAAEQDARNTVGVAYVRNRIKVRPDGGRDPAEVASDISEAFDRDPYLYPYEISANFIDGTAYLYGSVNSSFDKARAEDLAANVKGVAEVRNLLGVELDTYYNAHDPYLYDWSVNVYGWSHPPLTAKKSDSEIKEAIESQLWWSPFVDADEVEVSVNNGKATLSGIVDSIGESRAATQNAFDGGAISVTNHLGVQ